MPTDFETLSNADKVQAIDREIGILLTGGVTRYSINGRSVDKIGIDQLKGLRQFYSELAAEDRGGFYPVELGNPGGGGLEG